MDKWLKTGTLKRSASRTEIRTTDLAAMGITVDQCCICEHVMNFQERPSVFVEDFLITEHRTTRIQKPELKLAKTVKHTVTETTVKHTVRD
ncbi:hypothetical protein AVEN_30710-1 [Araneus ventricosus]|uniref:Uncharacterized protein n=1 Tax=Araneus ventricosus TaxID=182803 RepID=A0A4Y2J194_ARAVE|nr:hypothetical protein AVEN_30710-1 [Araneus ventricosus]